MAPKAAAATTTAAAPKSKPSHGTYQDMITDAIIAVCTFLRAREARSFSEL